MMYKSKLYKIYTMLKLFKLLFSKYKKVFLLTLKKMSLSYVISLKKICVNYL